MFLARGFGVFRANGAANLSRRQFGFRAVQHDQDSFLLLAKSPRINQYSTYELNVLQIAMSEYNSSEISRT